jgi:hypothetical protein
MIFGLVLGNVTKFDDCFMLGCAILNIYCIKDHANKSIEVKW